MKRSTVVKSSIIVIITAIVIYTIYSTKLIHLEESKNKNLDNIKKIEVGMSVAEVEEIMGKPYKILAINAPSASIRYKYKIPEGVDAVCDIAFDSTMLVVDVAFEIFEQDSTIP